MPNHRRKCQCCQKFFSFTGETKEPEETKFKFKVYKCDGKPAGFQGALRQGLDNRGTDRPNRKIFYSEGLRRDDPPTRHPTIDLADEYYRLLRIRIAREWRQRLIYDEDIVLCPPEGVKAMLWHKKVSSVYIENYPDIVYTSNGKGYGNYCYDCFHKSGTLAWTIWESRMSVASREWAEKFIAGKVIKEWWKKVYWSPDTKVGKKRFYQGLIKDGLMTKEDIDVEHWTDEQFLEGAE